MRSLRLSGFFLAASGLLMVWAADHLGAGDVSDVMALRIVAYACWMYGVLGLWALLGPEALQLAGLGRLRGHAWSIFVPALLTISRIMLQGVALAGLPGVLLTVLLADDGLARSTRLAQFFWCNIYIIAFALSLGLVGALSRVWSGRRARFIAVLLVGLPFALDASGVDVPGVISGLVWGMGKLIARGAP